MTTIHKYRLEPGRTVLSLPQGAAMLTAQMQDFDACMWAKVDPSKPHETRTFDTYGTGDTLPDDPRIIYVATFQTLSGLVWHVFETTLLK